MNLQINRTADGVIKYPPHKHRDYEIMLYLEGEGYMYTAQGNVPFKQGTILVVPSRVEHGSVSQNGFRTISIEGGFGSYLHFDTVMSLADNELQEGTVLAKLIYANRYADDTYLTSLCTAYLCFLMQRVEIEDKIHRGVERIVREISQNALDPEIDLIKILLTSGYSEESIRACFKKITGKTPTDFLTDVRIKHACYLIDIYKDTLTLSEIAEQCGYVDYIYFSKKFKTVMGMSPRVYRGQ